MAVNLAKGVTLIKASDNVTEARVFGKLFVDNFDEYRRISNTSANYQALAKHHHSMKAMRVQTDAIGSF